MFREYRETLQRAPLGHTSHFLEQSEQQTPLMLLLDWAGVPTPNFTDLVSNFTSHSNLKAADLPHFGRTAKIYSLMPCPRYRESSACTLITFFHQRAEGWVGGVHRQSVLKSQGETQQRKAQCPWKELHGGLHVTQQKPSANIYCLACADVGGG